jgi:CheY-like chemotaxis protein
MEKTVLIVTAIDGAENLARALSREANAVVEIARSRRAALARLRRDPVTAVLMDSSMPDAEMTTSEMVWQNADGAMPLELNLPTLGANGVVRLLRSLLDGREQAEALGRREAAAAVAQELQSTITSLLLQSDLILRETALPPEVAEKAREVRELAETLRVRLRSSYASDGGRSLQVQ